MLTLILIFNTTCLLFLNWEHILSFTIKKRNFLLWNKFWLLCGKSCRKLICRRLKFKVFYWCWCIRSTLILRKFVKLKVSSLQRKLQWSGIFYNSVILKSFSNKSIISRIFSEIYICQFSRLRVLFKQIWCQLKTCICISSL